MICLCVLLFLFISSTSYFNNQVLAIPVEGLYGGQLADPHEIAYQVVVIRKSLQTGKTGLSCSAAIIGKKLILTVAQCFLDEYGNLDNYEYAILADTIKWTNGGIAMEIDQILLPAEGHYYINDIAVAKLLNNLNIGANTYLTKLDIPKYDESFSHQSGKVSGYGYSHIVFKVSGTSSYTQEMRSKAWSDHSLRHANVSVSTETRCSVGYTHIDISRQFCGTMSKDKNGRNCGLCDDDLGSPLVINNKVVGLSSQTHYDCDDTVYGSAYTKVSAFAPFINAIINKNPLPGTVTLKNIRNPIFYAAPAA